MRPEQMCLVICSVVLVICNPSHDFVAYFFFVARRNAIACAGEPFDKAGAYGIQGPAGLFIKGVQGCHFNVMGFPLHDFAAALKGLIERRQLIL